MSLEEKRRRAREAHAREQQEAKDADKAIDWPELIPLDDGADIAPPPVPLDVFPWCIQQYIQGVAESIDCSLDYVAASVIAASAAAIGATARLTVKDEWREQPSLYMCLVGGPSERKSPPMNEVFRPLSEEHLRRMDVLHSRDEDRVRARRKGAAAFGLDGSLDDAAKPYANDEGELLINTATPESFARLFRRQRRGVCLFYEDMSGWFDGMDQYKGGRGDERSTYLKIYDGKPATIGRKDKSTVIKSACLTIFGNIQPRMLRPLFAKRDGLAARFVLIYPKERAMSPERFTAVEQPMRKQWFDAVAKMLGRSLTERDFGEYTQLEPTLYDLSPEGRERFTDFTVWLCTEHTAAEPNSLYSEYLGKFTGICTRLALIFRVLREACGMSVVANTVSAHDVIAAARYCEYAAGMAKRVYGAAVTDWRIDPSARVLEWIRRHNAPAFSRSQAWQAMRGSRTMFRKPEDLIAPLKFLQEHNCIREMDRGPRGVGRSPTDCYEVHPSLLRDAKEA